MTSLHDAPWLTSGSAARVLGLLDADGEEARAVGGVVRNALLGVAIGDIDIATTARPEVVIARAGKAGLKTVPTGIAHGTVTVIAEGHPFEVTTLREDVETFGRQARVEFGRSWERDAARRDFTINALSVTRDGKIYDYVGGLDDIAKRRVRFIGDPARRIAEDYLRILRFFRIHAAYGKGDLDRQALDACAAGRDGLDLLSAERIHSELFKLLVAKGAAQAVDAMSDWGLLVAVLAGVPYRGTFRSMAAIEETLDLAPDPVRRLAALAAAMPEDAIRLVRHLRLSRAEATRLDTLASMWWRVAPSDEADGKAWLYRIGPERYSDCVMMAWARSGAPVDDSRWRSLIDLPARWSAPSLPFQSAQFIARGLEAGPKLGQALAWAEERWIAEGFPDDAAELERLTRDAVARFGKIG
jgi:poly(A) polymerase